MWPRAVKERWYLAARSGSGPDCQGQKAARHAKYRQPNCAESPPTATSSNATTGRPYSTRKDPRRQTFVSLFTRPSLCTSEDLRIHRSSAELPAKNDQTKSSSLVTQFGCSARAWAGSIMRLSICLWPKMRWMDEDGEESGGQGWQAGRRERPPRQCAERSGLRHLSHAAR